MSLNFQEIQELLTAIAQTSITELELETGDFKLKVSKGVVQAPVIIGEPTPVTTIAPTVAAQPAVAIAPTTTAAPDNPVPSPVEKKGVPVTSPMVGTFYRAPAPGEAPFVQVGDRISSGHTVCIIEAMKLMNEIEAEVNGQIIEILVEDGQPVEYGQTLMLVNPN